MTDTLFRQLVADLHESLGVQPAESTGNAHFDVFGTTVALVCDEASTGDTIWIHFDLVHAPQEAMGRQMLKANMSAHPTQSGHFALHPEDETAVYTIRVPMTVHLTAETLAATIVAGREEAHQRFQSEVLGPRP